MKLITTLILGIIFLITFTVVFWVNLKTRRKWGVGDSSEPENPQKDVTSLQFFMTDADFLLRYYKGKWAVLNPQRMKWEVPTFEIGDLYTAKSISEEEAGMIVRKMFKLKIENMKIKGD